MSWLVSPFADNPFLQRSLLAATLVAVGCAIAGTFVVIRGMAFLGDALAHGVLPGVAGAALLGLPHVLGAALGAAAMIGGTQLITRRTRLPRDTAIGLLFVGMLALGVVLVSRSAALRGDLLGVLFGEVLGVTRADIVAQALTTAVIAGLAATFRRPLLIVAYDPEQADVAGWSSRAVELLMLVLVTVAVVMSFRTVGTLLVVGLLVAPAATGALLARRVTGMVGWAIATGVLSVYAGLLASFHFRFAAGASIVVVAVAIFFAVLLAQTVQNALRRASR